MKLITLTDTEILNHWETLKHLMLKVIPSVTRQDVPHYAEYHVWSVDATNKVVGFMEFDDNSTDETELFYIASTSRGCGSFMLNHLKANYKRIILDSLEDAKQFYIKQGFIQQDDFMFKWSLIS